MSTEQAAKTAARPGGEMQQKRKLPPEVNILLVLIGIALVFELLGWIFVGQSFLMNKQRLPIIILQVSVIGIIAVGVTQVIITGGIDLSSGSVVGMTAMVAASFAQTSDLAARRLSVAHRHARVSSRSCVGLGVGLLAGLINGSLIAYTSIPPFIATLGMMVSARGLAKWYTHGQPVGAAHRRFTLASAELRRLRLPGAAAGHHLPGRGARSSTSRLRYTRYGKFTYAIGANPQAARVSGINIGRHLIKVYAIAGLLSGLAGVVAAARARSGQAGMGVAYELDAIAAAVIGGTSLAGGVGRITGTVIGTIILGVMTSGFTFLRVDAYYQEIVKGVIIVAAVIIDQHRQRKRRKA